MIDGKRTYFDLGPSERPKGGGGGVAGGVAGGVSSGAAIRPTRPPATVVAEGESGSLRLHDRVPRWATVMSLSRRTRQGCQLNVVLFSLHCIKQFN